MTIRRTSALCILILLVIHSEAFLSSRESWTRKLFATRLFETKLTELIKPVETNYHADALVEYRPSKHLIHGMRMKRLPKSGLIVSEIGIGSGTFGGDTSQTEADHILDVSLKECGINFIDTAELYPIPYRASQYGTSERIVGDYLSEHSKSFREQLVISSSICGYSNYIDWCRNKGLSGDSASDKREFTRVTRKQVIEAVDSQLKRLNTDYIDILQFQWPERYVPFQGTTDYQYMFERNKEDVTSVQEQLEIVNDLMKQGKIRAFGLSNESPYGVGLFTTTARLLGLPEPVTLQTSVNLVERHDASRHFAEACAKSNSNLGLIAHSALAGGVLTGKYNLQSVRREYMRLFKYPGFTNRYVADEVIEAMDSYLMLANDFDLPMSVIALAWVYSQPYVFSTLIGVSKPSQLLDNIQALNLVPLNDDRIVKAINRIHRKHIDPSKLGASPLNDGLPTDDIVYDEDDASEMDPDLQVYYDQFLMDSEMKMKDKEHRRLREKYSKRIIR